MAFEKLTNTHKGLILLGVIAVGLLVSYNWDTITGWFKSSPATPTPKGTDCDPHKIGFQIDGTQNQTKCGVGGTERIVYDTKRCCQTNNPCGWSRETYNRACA